jgi:hypothetical protein
VVTMASEVLADAFATWVCPAKGTPTANEKKRIWVSVRTQPAKRNLGFTVRLRQKQFW